MSWNLSYTYACIEFTEELSRESLRLMLADLAPTLLRRHQSDPHGFDSLDDIAYELEEGEINHEQAIAKIEDLMWLYLDHIQTIEGKTTLVVRSEDESDHDEAAIAEEITKHLFYKTGKTHFIMRCATFDNAGGYSHQWIGYLKQGEIVLRHTDEYFEEMFGRHPALMAT